MYIMHLGHLRVAFVVSGLGPKHELVTFWAEGATKTKARIAAGLCLPSELQALGFFAW